jgi:hypothetical protein
VDMLTSRPIVLIRWQRRLGRPPHLDRLSRSG